VVAFWIPRNLPRLPGLTSNFELGLWLRSGKVVLGAPPGADAMDYLLHAAQRAGVRCATTLAETLDLALQLTKSS
jgi:hypothetical protein